MSGNESTISEGVGSAKGTSAAHAEGFAQVDHERIMAMQVPSQFANRFYVVVNPPIMRLAFGEKDPATQRVQFNGAISMTLEDAVALSELISQFVRRAPPDGDKNNSKATPSV